MANYDEQGIKSSSKNDVWDGDNDQLAGKRVDDNAVIFVMKKLSATGADAKIVTGKTLKGWKDFGDFGQYISQKSNGINSVMVGTLINDDDSYGSKDGNYAIVVDEPENVRINSTNYVSLSVWNGTENVTMLIKDNTKNKAVKGQVFSYETDGTEKNGDKEVQVIKSYKAVNTSAAMLGASADGKKFDVELTDTGVAGTGKSTTYKVTEDTTVLFLDGKKGVAGGDLTSYAAMESSIKDLFIKNVYYVVDKDKDLDLLVVAVDGKLKLNDEAMSAATGANKVEKVDNEKLTIKLKADATLQEVVDEIDYCVGGTFVTGATTTKDGSVILVNAYGKETTYTVEKGHTFTAE